MARGIERAVKQAQGVMDRADLASEVNDMLDGLRREYGALAVIARRSGVNQRTVVALARREYLPSRSDLLKISIAVNEVLEIGVQQARRLERPLLAEARRLLGEYSGNLAAVAEVVGIHRNNLYEFKKGGVVLSDEVCQRIIDYVERELYD